MTPKTDIFKPAAEISFSKSQVNKAGKLCRKFYGRDWDAIKAAGKSVFDGFDMDQLVDALTAVTWWRLQHADPLKKVAANLRYHVGAEGGLIDGKIDVTQRLKRRPTILNKLEREPTMQLTNMYDIGGVRARLPSLKHVYAVSRRLKKTWTVKSTRDYVAEPKESGYRALHHGVKRDGRLIEVQLRTVRQDAWANQVEEDGRNLGVEFKSGLGHDDVHAYYRAVADAFATLDRGEPLSEDQITGLNKRYAIVADELGRS